MAALDWVICTAIAVMEFGVVGQVGFEATAPWRAPFYNNMPRRRIIGRWSSSRPSSSGLNSVASARP